MGDLKLEGSPWVNDLAIAEDGTIYATQTGDLGPEPDTSSWRVLKVYPTGEHEVLIEGAPLHQPNGYRVGRGGKLSRGELRRPPPC